MRILLTRVAAEGGLPAGLTTDPERYDAWFRTTVQEALDDPRPATPHDQVMQEAAPRSTENDVPELPWKAPAVTALMAIVDYVSDAAHAP